MTNDTLSQVLSLDAPIASFDQYRPLLHAHLGPVPPPFLLHAHLGLVPFLRLVQVLGGQGLVLLPDVPQGGGEVGLDHVHLDLDVLVLELGLQVGQLLEIRTKRGEGEGQNRRKRSVRERVRVKSSNEHE